MRYVVTVEGETFEIEVGPEGRVWVNRRPLEVDFQGIDGLPQYSLLVDHRSYEAHVVEGEGEECQVVVAGRFYRARRCADLQRRPAGDGAPGRQAGHRRGDGPAEVVAPLPGLLVELRVVEGQQVAAGDVVAVLESMKMNLELRAGRSGVVRSLCAAVGQEVGQGEVLAVID